jgi:hypothetical protein
VGQLHFCCFSPCFPVVFQYASGSPLVTHNGTFQREPNYVHTDSDLMNRNAWTLINRNQWKQRKYVTRLSRV